MTASGMCVRAHNIPNFPLHWAFMA